MMGGFLTLSGASILFAVFAAAGTKCCRNGGLDYSSRQVLVSCLASKPFACVCYNFAKISPASKGGVGGEYKFSQRAGVKSPATLTHVASCAGGRAEMLLNDFCYAKTFSLKSCFKCYPDVCWH